MATGIGIKSLARSPTNFRNTLAKLLFTLLLALLGTTLQGDALDLVPSRVELAPGEEAGFGLRLQCAGLRLPVLRASCSGGSLDEGTGRYLAPQEPGVYQVRVWATDRPGLEATATILVLPKRLPVVERFIYTAPEGEVSWKVQGAQEVRLDPGEGGLPPEGRAPATSGSGWITLWASNEAGSVSKVLAVPVANPPVVVSVPPVEVPVSQPQETPAAPLPWTLQVIVLARPEGVQKLKASGHLDHPGIFTFEISLTRGRRATCICYGRFASLPAALEAVEQVPQALRLLAGPPCPRTVPNGI